MVAYCHPQPPNPPRPPYVPQMWFNIHLGIEFLPYIGRQSESVELSVFPIV